MLDNARAVTGLPDAELLAPIADGVPVTLAELVFGVTHEGAADVDDLLDRRTRIGLVPPTGPAVPPPSAPSRWSPAAEATRVAVLPDSRRRRRSRPVHVLGQLRNVGAHR